MTGLFLTLLNRSIAAGWLILAVMALRLVLRRAPKWSHCLLWALVAVRLLCPVSIESGWSLIPSSEPIPTEVTAPAPRPAAPSGVTVIENVISPGVTPAPAEDAAPVDDWASAAAVVWLAGAAALAGCALVSYLRLRRLVREAVGLGENLYLCDHIPTPFILGLLRPRIYLPSDMDGAGLDSVIAHERAHLARHDHWWKPLGWAILTLYWFHPLCWAAYVLLCRDIELACDEKVVCTMDAEAKKAYSMALLSCSAPRRLLSACPLAFGEVGVKARIRGVLHYKKPAFWVVAVAVLACAAAAVCFLTNPKAEPDAAPAPALSAGE